MNDGMPHTSPHMTVPDCGAKRLVASARHGGTDCGGASSTRSVRAGNQALPSQGQSGPAPAVEGGLRYWMAIGVPSILVGPKGIGAFDRPKDWAISGGGDRTGVKIPHVVPT